MSGDVYGYDLEEFLTLDPDEIAAAIWPEILRVWESRTDQPVVGVWNLVQSANLRFGSDVAGRYSEGWQWLCNQGYLSRNFNHNDPDAHMITRAGVAFEPHRDVADQRAMGLLRTANLDRRLAKVSLPSFRRGQYDLAVFAAMREVEDRVRHASRLRGDGVALMGEAFGRGGPLRDTSLDAGEQVARMELFRGAIGVHRNATGHQAVDYSDPQEAAEAVLMANNLLRHLQRAAVANRRPGRPPARRARQP